MSSMSVMVNDDDDVWNPLEQVAANNTAGWDLVTRHNDLKEPL